MKNLIFSSLFFLIIVLNQSAQAMYTEIGLNYMYKKSFIDSTNNIEQQGTTGSVSLYFWDQVAIEISYTNALLVKKEQELSASSVSIRTTSQVSDIYGLDLIYVIGDRKAAFSPYVKAGVGYIVKNQTTQIDNNPPWTVGPYTGFAPSYGCGLKIMISEALALKMGYDVVQTPIDGNNKAQDINGRAGLSWIF
jgi:outer membrane protein W